MRVLMVNDHAPAAGWGAEIHLARLIAGLGAGGDVVETFTPDHPRRGVEKVFDLWDPIARRKLRAHASAFRPDVVHFHNFQRELSASVLGAAPALPRVLSAHDHRLFGDEDAGRTGLEAAWDALKPIKARFERALARRSVDVATAPSRDLVERLRRAGFAEVHHIPYFLDAGPEPETPPSASEKIVFVGRVSFDKGVTDLLEAFARIAGGHPSASVTIVGSGDELGAIRRQVPPSIEERVSFLGRLDPPAVRDVMTSARLICIPSRKREGSPITAIEAALAGRPMVVSDDPGLKESLEEAAAGIVVPRADVASIANGLSALLEDPTRADRLGRAGRVYALGHWTTEQGVRLTRDAYARAIERAAVTGRRRRAERDRR